MDPGSPATLLKQSAIWLWLGALRRAAVARCLPAAPAVSARAGARRWLRVRASTAQPARASVPEHSTKPSAGGRAARAGPLRARAPVQSDRGTAACRGPAVPAPRQSRAMFLPPTAAWSVARPGFDRHGAGKEPRATTSSDCFARGSSGTATCARPPVSRP